MESLLAVRTQSCEESTRVPSTVLRCPWPKWGRPEGPLLRSGEAPAAMEHMVYIGIHWHAYAATKPTLPRGTAPRREFKFLPPPRKPRLKPTRRIAPNSESVGVVESESRS
jgi:hypothetical protein